MNDRIAFQLQWMEDNKFALHAASRVKGTERYRRWYAANKKRLQSNVLHRIAMACRCRIRRILKGTVRPSSAILLGCTRDELRLHLERQWTEGMTWENYGEWHIDHIRPCASFNLLDPEQVVACFHYSNLQPLWARDNQRKHTRWNGAPASQQAAIA
jgi:hypothetical protein